MYLKGVFMEKLPQFTRMITVEQSLSDFGVKYDEKGELVRLDGSRIKGYHAFKNWINKLVPGEKLPRGKFFRNKKPTHFFSAHFFDEFSTFNNEFTVVQQLK